MEEYKDSNGKEWLVYVVTIFKNYNEEEIKVLSDEDFIEEAEINGKVFSLKGFQEIFNDCNEFNNCFSEHDIIRILYV